MKNIFTKNRIKIVFVLFFTYMSVKLISPNLFIAYSPKINPVFIAKVINTPAKIATIPGKFLSSLSKFSFFDKNEVSPNINTNINPGMIAKSKYVTPPSNLVFKYMSKGVSAAEDPGTGMNYIKIEAGTKYKISGYITVDGVQYPKIEFVE